MPYGGRRLRLPAQNASRRHGSLPRVCRPRAVGITRRAGNPQLCRHGRSEGLHEAGYPTGSAAALTRGVPGRAAAALTPLGAPEAVPRRLKELSEKKPAAGTQAEAAGHDGLKPAARSKKRTRLLNDG